MQISAALVKELRERTGAGMMECKKALVEADGDIELAAENLRKAGQAKADKKASRVAAEGVIAIERAGDTVAMVELNCETDFVAREDQFRQFAQQIAARAAATATADVVALNALPLEQGGSESIEGHARELVTTIGEKITVRRAAVHQLKGEHFGVYVHGGRIGVVVDVNGGSEESAKDVAMHVAASNPLALDESQLPSDTLEKEREILLAQVADSGKPPEIQEKMVAGRLNKYLKEVTLLGQPFVKDPDVTVAKFLAANGASVNAYSRFEVGEGIEKKQENFAEEVMAQVRGG